MHDFRKYNNKMTTHRIIITTVSDIVSQMQHMHCRFTKISSLSCVFSYLNIGLRAGVQWSNAVAVLLVEIAAW